MGLNCARLWREPLRWALPTATSVRGGRGDILNSQAWAPSSDADGRENRRRYSFDGKGLCGKVKIYGYFC